MHKIALIQPIILVGKALRIQKAPTGIQFLAAQLKRDGYEVRMFHEPVAKTLFEKINEFKPDFVGISTMTTNFPAGKEAARGVKKLFDIPIILGGWHASGCAVSYMNGYETWSLKEILNNKSPFDFVVVGEAEVVFSKLLNTLTKTLKNELMKALESMKGIGYLDKDGKINVSKQERVSHLDSLPDPDWTGLDIDLYRDQRTHELDLSIHAQRGCRFNCAYCETPVVYPGKSERFSVQRVIDYAKHLTEKFRPTVITFTDEDFMADLGWLERLCQEIIKEGLNAKVRFDSFASTLDIIRAYSKGILGLMKKANFSTYFVGIEALNKSTLITYNRPFGKEMCIEDYMQRTQQAIDISNKNGLRFFGDYMIGYFMESEKEIREGFRRLKQLRGMPYVYLPIFTPIPGTALWKVAIEKNMLIKNKEGKVNWELFDCSHQVTKIGFNLQKLRDELEQDYYTSESYLDDMKLFIEKEPEMLKGFFLPLFLKLKKDYPKNKKIRIIVKKLKVNNSSP